MGMISNVLYPNCRKSYSVYHRIQQYHSSCWCYCHRATYFVFHSRYSQWVESHRERTVHRTNSVAFIWHFYREYFVPCRHCIITLGFTVTTVYRSSCLLRKQNAVDTTTASRRGITSCASDCLHFCNYEMNFVYAFSGLTSQIVHKE